MAANFMDKVIIITGASSGIGLSTATSFLALGAKVACLDVTPPPPTPSPGTSTSNPPDSDSQDSSKNRLDIKCNVSDENSVNDAIKQVIEKWGRVDVLVNCAGVMDNYSRPSDTTTAHWEKVLGVNLNGPFYTTRAVLPHMLKNTPTASPNAPPAFTRTGEQLPPPPPSKGVIINICSIASVGGGSAGTAYTVSKHGLLGLTRSTAWMHRDDGIRCNAILPGAIATNIYGNSGVQKEINMEGMKRCEGLMHMMGLIRTPDVVSSAVVWLVGAENVNGAEVKVDGGWTVS